MLFDVINVEVVGAADPQETGTKKPRDSTPVALLIASAVPSYGSDAYSAMSLAALPSAGLLGVVLVPTLWSITGGLPSCRTSAV